MDGGYCRFLAWRFRPGAIPEGGANRALSFVEGRAADK